MSPYESRPGVPGAAKKAFGGAAASVPQLNVAEIVQAGLVHLDLRHQADVSRAIQGAVHNPPGTVIVLQVDRDQIVPLAVEDLRIRGTHLGLVVVDCPDPATRARWAESLRYGAHQWVNPLGPDL